jgi:hypothetical protein
MLTVEESQGYKHVCENVTSKRGRDIKLFVRMLNIEESEGYQFCFECYMEER